MDAGLAVTAARKDDSSSSSSLGTLGDMGELSDMPLPLPLSLPLPLPLVLLAILLLVQLLTLLACWRRHRAAVDAVYTATAGPQAAHAAFLSPDSKKIKDLLTGR